ncbi:hypothetical protein RI367_002869 [Sorochytrium milnesiophthora]
MNAPHQQRHITATLKSFAGVSLHKRAHTESWEVQPARQKRSATEERVHHDDTPPPTPERVELNVAQDNAAQVPAHQDGTPADITQATSLAIRTAMLQGFDTLESVLAETDAHGAASLSGLDHAQTKINKRGTKLAALRDEALRDSQKLCI